MQSLADVVIDVKAGRRPSWPCHPNPVAIHRQQNPVKGDPLSEISDFGSNPRQLRMSKFVPRELPESSPLVVVLHGCQQTAQDINRGAGWSALAKECGFAVVLPEQKSSNNAQCGFNWFQPGDSRRGDGEALSVRQMVRRMIEDHGLNERRVYVVGLSAGRAMACALLAAYPEVFAGGAVIAWVAYGASNPALLARCDR
jgi:poly(hydroxyalkanoate) depolymerase family esterase